jgi:ankyrin repeat protein
LLAGSTKVTEFLLSKGIPVDIDSGYGTALLQAAINEQDKTVKVLLDHHANVYSPNAYYFIFLLFSRANMDR